jgi:hypothetical protein
VALSISGNLLKLACLSDNDNDNPVPTKITEFLIRQNGDLITELLAITGGPGGNSLIKIKGDLTLKNISTSRKTVVYRNLRILKK